MKHCYCATDQIWLKDPGNPLSKQAAQEGVISAKCTAQGCRGGWSLVALLLGGVGMYVGGGAAYRRKMLHASGKEMIPHLEFWLEVKGLVEDGVVFARGDKGKLGSSNKRTSSHSKSANAMSPYGSVGTHRGDAGKGSGSKETKKDKRNKREKANRQEAKGSSRGEENGLLDGKRRSSSSPGASTTPEAAATAPTLAAAGTASAGGGRWVHVPN